MDLIINHVKIKQDIKSILSSLKKETNNKYFNIVEDKGFDVVCQCPFHKDGAETKPACFIYNDSSSPTIEFGTYHCFACGAKGRLRSLVGFCLDLTREESDEWLIDNFGSSYVEEVKLIDKLEFGKRETKEYLDESILDSFEYNNDNALNYLINKRHLSKEVIDYFKIGYNLETASVTFPCRDLLGHLVGIFERNILSKRFHIPKINPKPVYLLYESTRLNYNFVYVVESQINALTCWSWGYPAVALFGTGAKSQYDDLKKSGIRKFCCVFDGDNAGREGLSKFIKNMPDSIMIFYKIVPEGKDVNDLTEEEFNELPIYSVY